MSAAIHRRKLITLTMGRNVSVAQVHFYSPVVQVGSGHGIVSRIRN